MVPHHGLQQAVRAAAVCVFALWWGARGMGESWSTTADPGVLRAQLSTAQPATPSSCSPPNPQLLKPWRRWSRSTSTCSARWRAAQQTASSGSATWGARWGFARCWGLQPPAWVTPRLLPRLFVRDRTAAAAVCEALPPTRPFSPHHPTPSLPSAACTSWTTASASRCAPPPSCWPTPCSLTAGWASQWW